jgi:prepilin-type N-terminal cleavage/methylation domain-containing protein
MPQRKFEINLGKSGWSLMELLCVIAIIAILSAMYLGALAGAFVHVKKFLEGL